MKTFFRLAAALLLSCSISHCAYAATPLVDAQMTGANNQVKSGATLTIKPGASLVIEGGGTISGTQPSNANLSALAGVTSSADQLFFFTGSGSGDVSTLTAFSRTLFPLNTRTSWFNAIAPASPSTNQLLYFNGTDWAKLTPGSTLTVSGGVIDAVTAPLDATYITRIPSSTLTAEFAMSSLATGLVKNTAVTGVPTIAIAGTDYLAPSAIGTTVEGYFSNSAGLLAALSDPTGTGSAVFGTSPTFTTQITVPKIVYSGSVTESTGTGSPEGVVTASVGSLFHRTDGSTGTTLYIKESGTGNTGWTAVAAGGGGGGSGTVNSGTANQLAYYSSSGTAVSGLATANNGVLVTNGSGVPSISGTLPALNTGTLTWSGGGNISGSSGAMTIAAAGSNQNIALTPSGLGGVRITINSVITDAVTQSPLIVKNSNTGTSGHASVVIDKGSDSMAALFGFLSAGVSKWDAGLLDDNNFTIRDTVNNRKIFKITTGAPANSLLIGSSGALQLAGYGTGVLTTDSSGNVTAASTVAVSGAISTSSTTASTSTTTGSGIFGGGVGVAGAVYAGGMIVSNQAAASGVGSIRMNSSSPRLQWLRTGGTANQGLWDMENGGDGTFNFRALNDADSLATNIWTVVRSGTTISSQTFAGPVGIGVTPSLGAVHISSTGSFSDIQLALTRTSVGTYGLSLGGSAELNFVSGGYGGTTRMTLTSSGALRLTAYGAGTLTTDSSGNVTATSDVRLKDVIGDYSRGLEDIEKLRPILYRWKHDTGHDTEHVYAGFSAQNVKSAMPEAVGQMPDGMLTLQDRPIIAALVNANRELDRRLMLLTITFVAWMALSVIGFLAFLAREK